jgi:hypothetical protein
LVFGLWSLVFGLCPLSFVLCILYFSDKNKAQSTNHQVQSTKYKDQKPKTHLPLRIVDSGVFQLTGQARMHNNAHHEDIKISFTRIQATSGSGFRGAGQT